MCLYESSKSCKVVQEVIAVFKCVFFFSSDSLTTAVQFFKGIVSTPMVIQLPVMEAT